MWVTVWPGSVIVNLGTAEEAGYLGPPLQFQVLRTPLHIQWCLDPLEGCSMLTWLLLFGYGHFLIGRDRRR